MTDNTLIKIGELQPTFGSRMEEEEAALKTFGTELKAGKRRVFFCTADLDLQPLHRFTHKADTFVFVDPRKTDVELAVALNILDNKQTEAGTGLETFIKAGEGWNPMSAYEAMELESGKLAKMRADLWARIPNLEKRTAWGAAQRLHRHVGGKRNEVWFVFIAGSPLVAYKRLFLQTRTAPACLVLSTPDEEYGGPGVANQPEHQLLVQQWCAFAGFDGQLGQQIRENNAPLPELFVEDGTTHWPDRKLVYAIPNWRRHERTHVCTLRNELWPNLVTAPETGRRRVVLTRAPLNPQTAKAAGAVIVSLEKFRDYRWPDGKLVILNGQMMFVDDGVADGPGVINANIVGMPLLRSLARIEAVCALHGITKVAVQGLPGFEDEAGDLAWWRQLDGQIKELTLHLECDGHFLDYAKAADVID